MGTDPQHNNDLKSTTVGAVYPKVSMTAGRPISSPSFPELEQEVLQYWEEHDTFRKSVSQRDEAEEYVFYDGPPFANGLPHYGHLLTGYVKDVVPRFRTMLGYKVERRFGWDTHGLPAELEAEKQLGITNRGEIDDMGLTEFNSFCRTSVLRYTKEWEEYVTRQGRWVDFENDYKTLDLDFMESVLWAFKTLYDKGLIYKGFRVLPYSWAEHTPLSNQETHLDDAYRMRQDPAVTITMPLQVPENHELAGAPFDGATAIIWTTTPWTLPSNLSIAVHPEEKYVVVKVAGEKAPAELQGKSIVLAAARMPEYQRELGKNPEILAETTGDKLAGIKYTPAFDFFVDNPNSFQVLTADYVTMDSGTGVVHQAPGFGEEDMDTCKKYDIPLVIPVDMDGKFTAEVPPYEGLLVFDANPEIIKDLKKAGRVLRHETIDHSYPHSWRSGEPLIYMALPSWFVEVTKFRDRMVELNHKEINWIPDHIRDGQFGKWLENARDWNISRNRYWGAPIPVWESDDPKYPRIDVYGSLDEMERDFGIRPDNLHRPAIDQLVRPNPDDPTGKSMMRRVPKCWTAGSNLDPCRLPKFITHSKTKNGLNPTTRVTLLSSTLAKLAVGSTLHVRQLRFSISPPIRQWRHTALCSVMTALRCPNLKGNYPNVNEVFDRDAPMPCAGSSCRHQSCARRQPHGYGAGHSRWSTAGTTTVLERLQLSSKCTQRRKQPGVPIAPTCWIAIFSRNSQKPATL